MRCFRCIYVNCFNILTFFCWCQHKIEKMHFFWQFQDHNSGREFENYTNDRIFFNFLFLLYLLVTFISEFENTLNSFSNSLLQSILVCKIPQFFSKSYWFGQLISYFSRKLLKHPEVIKSILCFVYPLEQNIHFFRI